MPRYEGKWEARIIENDKSYFLSEVPVVLSYSNSADTYWGYSKVIISPQQKDQIPISIEIVDLMVDRSKITYKLKYLNGNEDIHESSIEIGKKGKNIYSKELDGYSFTLSRSK